MWIYFAGRLGSCGFHVFLIWRRSRLFCIKFFAARFCEAISGVSPAVLMLIVGILKRILVCSILWFDYYLSLILFKDTYI